MYYAKYTQDDLSPATLVTLLTGAKRVRFATAARKCAKQNLDEWALMSGFIRLSCLGKFHGWRVQANKDSSLLVCYSAKVPRTNEHCYVFVFRSSWRIFIPI